MFVDYIIIILAVVCFAAQFAFTKTYEKCVKQTTVTSLVMLVATSVIGALIYLFIGGFKVEVTLFSLFWAIIFAVIMIPYYMIGIKVLSLGSLAVYSMFMMLGGMLVPFFYGIVFLGEPHSPAKWVGCVMLSVFIIMQALVQNSADESCGTKKKSKNLFFILCLVIFFINGMTGVVAKAHQEGANNGKMIVDEISFTVISCALTAIISGIMLIAVLLRSKESRAAAKTSLTCPALLSMSAIGAATYTGNFLHLIAANNVPASVQFPLVSGGVIVLSAVVSAAIFREKLTKKEWISIAGAFVSTFLFAF